MLVLTLCLAAIIVHVAADYVMAGWFVLYNRYIVKAVVESWLCGDDVV